MKAATHHTEIELPVVVDYCYTPAQAERIRCEPEDAQPYESSTTEITAVHIGGDDVLEHLTEAAIAELREEIRLRIEDGEE